MSIFFIAYIVSLFKSFYYFLDLLFILSSIIFILFNLVFLDLEIVDGIYSSFLTLLISLNLAYSFISPIHSNLSSTFSIYISFNVLNISISLFLSKSYSPLLYNVTIIN